MLFGAVVMSGDVGCWSVCGGFLVGVLCVEFIIMSAMSADNFQVLRCVDLRPTSMK